MEQHLIEEFQNRYEADAAPELPEFLKEYRFISCLRDLPQRKIWLLENPRGRRVLCKYAAAEYVSMLRSEQRVAAYESACGSFSFLPYIIDYAETDGEAYLLREYIEGSTLQELIERGGVCREADALLIIQKLAICLSILHRADPPFIYRDLKPSNVVLTQNGECYLIDLGAMRQFSPDRRQDTELIGTTGTAAPEQYGARQTDARTDVYALGRLYSYLLTGELDPEKAELPRSVSAAIHKATAFDPDQRYESAEMFVNALTPVSPGKKRCLTAIVALSMALALALCLLLVPMLPVGAREVSFDSPLLRRAVLSSLGKADGEAVYYRELADITHLLVCGTEIFEEFSQHEVDPYLHRLNGGEVESAYGSIQDLSLLARMTSLSELVLDYQAISDLSPLAGLPLTRLSLCGNPLSDLSPLSECASLRELNVSETDISDLSPLAGCPQLSVLNIDRTSVTSIAPLAHSPLTFLSIGDIVLEDYGLLKEIPLESLVCKGLPKEAFAAVSAIGTLKRIVLYQSGITSLSEVTMFCQIETLDLCDNQITDLSGIENFPNTSILPLGNNPLRDISGIGDAKALTELHLFNTPLTDFSPLTEAPQLKSLSLDESQLEALYDAIPEPWFEVNY